jgi:hypothetical protein
MRVAASSAAACCRYGAAAFGSPRFGFSMGASRMPWPSDADTPPCAGFVGSREQLGAPSDESAAVSMSSAAPFARRRPLPLPSSALACFEFTLFELTRFASALTTFALLEALLQLRWSGRGSVGSSVSQPELASGIEST